MEVFIINMIIELKPTQEQKNYAYNIINNHNLAQRGIFDGDKNKQFIGILAKVMICDFLKIERIKKKLYPSLIDFNFNNSSYNVKVFSSKFDYKPEYYHTIITSELKFNVDYFIFCSYNYLKDKLFLCGYISKEDFIKNSNHVNMGDFFCISNKENSIMFKVQGQGGLNYIDHIYIKEFYIDNTLNRFYNG
jgi:hypothetical protein